MRVPRLIGSEIYRRSTYGARHPLAIPRVSTALDLIRALGWIEDADYIDSPIASDDQLARFHDRDYIAAVRAAEAAGAVSAADAEKYNIGRNGNPVFPEIFRRPATACGGSVLAGELLAAHPGLIFHPAGGTHHGRPAEAFGFCYFNDPVLAILKLLDRRCTPVLYVDFDAHHGDGVEAAFAGSADVLTLSVHEAGRWPFTGKVEDRAGGGARNFPLPPGAGDADLAHVVEAAILPLARAFQPSAIVIQAGADGLADDPMAKLAYTNQGLWRAVTRVAGLSDRVLVLGGGGYNPWSVGRCWAGLWGALTGRAIPARLSGAAETILRALTWHHSMGRDPPSHWFETLADPPAEGDIHPQTRAVAAAALQP